MVIHEEKTVTVDVVSCGKAIYEERLRDLLETEENIGKILVIDTASGDYEMDADHVQAFFRLSNRQTPGNFFGMRIGYTTLGAFRGGKMQRTPPR
ncbi:MAG: hypothetical protein H7308_15565 [Chthonomonadaceae bacterium]|nr:hypothetical protein [Chthonomonadaceae bacterium]